MNVQVIKQYVITFFIFFLAILVVNCGGNNGSSDRATTQSVSMDTNNGGIGNGTTNVSRTPSIVLKFVTVMDPSTINSSSILLQPSLLTNNIKVNLGNFTVNESNTEFTFSPSEPLMPNTRYNLIITNTAKTTSGQSITGQFHFTTGNSITPMVSIVNPDNQATNLSLSPSIQVKFSSNVLNVNTSTVMMHAGSPSGSLIMISSITAGSDNNYTFNFESQLTGSTVYYIVFSTEIINNLGNSLSQTTFNFTTGNFNYPTVDIINPSNNATEVSLMPTIEVQFSESVNNVSPSTVTLHALSSTGEIISISTITESNNNIYTFSPESKLTPNTIYYIVLESAITNNLGYSLPTTIFNFTSSALANFMLVGDNGIISSLSSSHQLSNLSLPSNSFSDIAYGSGIAIIAGGQGLILGSTDGINWAIESSFSTKTFNTVKFLNGKFFALGDDSALISSTNGINWAVESISESCPDLHSITYKDGIYYIIGSHSGSGCLWSSSGGGNWAESNIDISQSKFFGIASDNDNLIIVGDDWGHSSTGVIYSSINGTSWELESTTDYNLQDVNYANNQFIAVGVNNRIYYATDIHNWTEANSGFTGDLWRTAYLGNTYFATGDNQILASAHGANWGSQSTGLANNTSIKGITYFNNMYISVGLHEGEGGCIYQSPVASNWSNESIGVTYQAIQSIAHNNDNLFVATSSGNSIVTSNNGTSWNLITPTGLPDRLALRAITYSNGYFIAVGTYYDRDLRQSAGIIARSRDGENWSYDSIPDTTFSNITYGMNKFVAVGESMDDRGRSISPGKIYSSESGINWNLIYTTPDSKINAITYSGTKFVAVGKTTTGDISSIALISNNGINWITESLPFSYELHGVVYGTGMFVAAGTSGSILTSIDGINWTERSSGFDNANLNNITYGVDQFVITGDEGIILVSSDGINWHQMPLENGVSFFGITSY